MAENKPVSPKSILIFVIVLFVLIASLSVASYLSSVKNIPSVAVQPTEEPTIALTTTPTPEPTETPTPTLNMDTTSWKTYSNESVGIEFKYPEELGIIDEIYTDNTNKDLAKGKKITVNFKKNNENGWFNFTAYSSNYQGEKEFLIFNGTNDIDAECLKTLQYGEQGDVCKFIEISEEKAVWQNFFIEDECAMAFGSQIYFNNKSVSAYKGLGMTFYLEDVKAKINRLYDCSDGGKAYAEAVVQSKNIMERKNLSEKDLQRLDIIDKILSTFKFIK